MTGDLDLGNNKIVNLADPTNEQDAASKKYVDNAPFLPLIGGTMTGPVEGNGLFDDSSKLDLVPEGEEIRIGSMGYSSVGKVKMGVDLDLNQKTVTNAKLGGALDLNGMPLFDGSKNVWVQIQMETTFGSRVLVIPQTEEFCWGST